MKAKFAVSYDLRKPGRNYQPLWDRLHAWDATRVLQSMWIIQWDTTAVAIRDDLKQYLDTNDGLIVVKLTGESAWTHLDDNGQSLKAA